MMIRSIVWGIAGVLVSIFAVWIVTSSWMPRGRVDVFLVVALFMISACGNLWMLYRVIRFEKNRFPLSVLAMFIPMAFVWYYVERVLPSQRNAGGA